MKTLTELMKEQQNAIDVWAENRSSENWQAVRAADTAIVEWLEASGLPNRYQRIQYDGKTFDVDYKNKALSFLFAAEVERVDALVARRGV